MKAPLVYAAAAALALAAGLAPAATVEQRLTALEARMAKAEGKLTTAQMAGKYSYLTAVRADGMSGLDGWTTRGTLTLANDGTFVLSITATSIVHVVGDTPSHAVENYTGDNADTGTWTWSGGVLTLDIDGGGDTTQHKFRHAAGGRLFANVDTYYIDAGADSEQWVQLLLRIN